MMLLAVTVSAVLLSTFSAVPVMCAPNGNTLSSSSSSPTSLPVITTWHSTSSHQQTSTTPTFLLPLSRSNHSNVLPSSINMSLLSKRRRQHPDPPKGWKATQKFLKNIVTPERKYRSNYLLYYLNYFREIFETYATSIKGTQNIIAIDQTSVPVKPVKKSKSVIHKENQYNLERNGGNPNTNLNVILNRLPVIKANNLRRDVFQKSPNFKHSTKGKLPFIDNVLKSDTGSVNNDKVENNNICNAGVNRTCVFKRSTKFQPSENLTNVSKSGYKSNINSQSGTTRTTNDISSLMDNRQTNTSSQERANITKNEPRPPVGSKVRQHHKRSSRPRGKQGRSTRRSRHPGRGKRRGRRIKGLSLWIDSKQVKTFSGYVMEIFVIHNSRVLPYILDPKFEGQLPVIPAQVESVNFTWRAGSKKYHYAFDHLYSQDEGILAVPVLSLPISGRVPRRPRVFSVEMQCTGNASGTTTFGIGLSLHTQQGQPLPGTPLRLQLRKECNYIGPDPECDEKCDNGGVCDEGQRCVCAEGYLGPYCDAALCYPRCLNGGTCTSPGRCSCPSGFNGRHCEGGICQQKCQNGGKCIQKDTCECRRGYYGNQCEFSKCVIPCINGGRCRDVNKCRCPRGFSGDHCEVMLSPVSPPSSSSPPLPSASSTPTRCRRRCRHGSCHHDANCHCHPGYTGRWCRRRSGRGGSKKKVWI